MKDVYVRAKTKKLLEENKGLKICDLGDLELGNSFLDMTPKTQAIKKR
jgi:hypothetical protein